MLSRTVSAVLVAGGLIAEPAFSQTAPNPLQQPVTQRMRKDGPSFVSRSSAAPFLR